MKNEPQPFFPTVKEFQKWMRDHPVVFTLAAAAATAVSVIAITRPLQCDDSDEDDDVKASISQEAVDSRLRSMSEEEEEEDDRTSEESSFTSDDLDVLTPSGRYPIMLQSTDRTRCQSHPSPSQEKSRTYPILHTPTCIVRQNSNHNSSTQRKSSRSVPSPEWGWYVSTTPPDDYYISG